MRVLSSVSGFAVVASFALAPPIHAQGRGPVAPPPHVEGPGWMNLAGPGSQLGVTVKDVERDKTDEGAAVEEVRHGSPAERAGFKKGDVIVQFDGERVRGARQLSRLVEETVPGRSVKATVIREGRRTDLTVAPEADRHSQLWIDGNRIREDVEGLTERLPRDFEFDFDTRGPGRRLGVSVLELTPQLAAYFAASGGVLVAQVDEGSAASRAGLKSGDVITSVNGEPVKSRGDLVRVLRRADDQDVTIGVVRERKEMSVKAKLEPSRVRPGRRT
jgi:serine protease Do